MITLFLSEIAELLWGTCAVCSRVGRSSIQGSQQPEPWWTSDYTSTLISSTGQSSLDIDILYRSELSQHWYPLQVRALSTLISSTGRSSLSIDILYRSELSQHWYPLQVRALSALISSTHRLISRERPTKTGSPCLWSTFFFVAALSVHIWRVLDGGWGGTRVFL